MENKKRLQFHISKLGNARERGSLFLPQAIVWEFE